MTPRTKIVDEFARWTALSAVESRWRKLDRLSNIVRAFNEQFSNVEWQDADKIAKLMSEEIPAKVAADTAYRNAMKNSDKWQRRFCQLRAVERDDDRALLAHHFSFYLPKGV